jgi:hypothetical protein
LANAGTSQISELLGFEKAAAHAPTRLLSPHDQDAKLTAQSALPDNS